MAGHQLGAATAAFGAGLVREQTGSYLAAFIAAGALAIGAAIVLARVPALGRRPVALAA